MKTMKTKQKKLNNARNLSINGFNKKLLKKLFENHINI